MTQGGATGATERKMQSMQNCRMRNEATGYMQFCLHNVQFGQHWE